MNNPKITIEIETLYFVKGTMITKRAAIKIVYIKLKLYIFLNFSISIISISFAVSIANTPKMGSMYKIIFDSDSEKNIIGITRVARSTVYIDFFLKYDLHCIPSDIRFTDQGKLTSGA